MQFFRLNSLKNFEISNRFNHAKGSCMLFVEFDELPVGTLTRAGHLMGLSLPLAREEPVATGALLPHLYNLDKQQHSKSLLRRFKLMPVLPFIAS
jgi:hypothetical protein